MSPSPDTYTHGHHEAVLRSHRWRTAENSAGYLLGLLAPGQRLLDVGCGPGTITVDLARYVAPGRVDGVDQSADVIAQATAHGRDAGMSSVAFAVGDVYRLDAPDASYDIVHAHQVLQHLTDPVAAIGEMRRVLVPGGVLAVRDSDYGAFTWSPADPMLDRWRALYREVTEHNRADCDAGRHLLAWVRAGGFRDITVSSSTWTFADPESRRWWGELWADRVTALGSSFATQALDYGLSTPAELAAIAAAFRRWSTDPDGVFIVVHGEIIARA